MASLNGSIPRNSGPEFVDEDLRVTPGFVQDVTPITPPGDGQPAAGPEEIPEEPVQPGPAAAEPAVPPRALAAVPDYTEEDLLFLSEAVWSLPGIIWERVPSPNPEKLAKWNHQFYKYCIKKGINPYDWLFDELPLAIATVSVAGEMWKGYKLSEPPVEKDKPTKGTEDWQHERDVAAQKEKDLQAGVIQTGPSPGGPGGPPA